jgi:hypothetical protein
VFRKHLIWSEEIALARQQNFYGWGTAPNTSLNFDRLTRKDAFTRC